ncbi:hypothetical protein [Clostridium psychrophilum]|uniref:hypothetical protein n=1 Tax=Clostridium psychrophilum TaxID=132926 RepID=UPI001C0C90DF|nr:hypothetical protein [Clostridium psychrophilum]MBU3181129.1 hypothetical protein [Clostridium psychrophilum]
MKFDDEEKFDTDKDELVWTKIITIFQDATDNFKTTHIVKRYKTESDEEYFLFEYIMADNNGNIVNNFNGYHWNEIVKQIDIPDYSYIYAQNVTNKDDYRIVTSGIVIKKQIEECMREQEVENSQEYNTMRKPKPTSGIKKCYRRLLKTLK